MRGGNLSGVRGRVAVAAALLGCATTAGLSGGADASSAVPSVALALKSAAAPASQLAKGRTIHFQGTNVVQYRQEVGGVPVLGGDVAVMSGAGDSVAPSVVTDASAAKVALPPRAKVSAARAIAIARRATGARGLLAKPTSSLAIDPAHGDVLVHKVQLASSKPQKDFQVLVDATSGVVVQKINVLHYAATRTGHAKLYTPNPVVMNGGYAGIGQGRKADHHDKNTPKLTTLRTPVTLDLINAGQNCLKGAYAEVRVGVGGGKPVCRKNLDWTKVKRADNRFEALEAYQQITQIQSFYHALGFAGDANVHPQRQVVIVDAFPEDNSFFRPSDRKVRFGSGAVDDAEDGDVITHEYGHSIQAAQVRGFGNCSCFQAEALGEGFGDFESAVNTSISPNVPGSYLKRAEYCIFDWDGTGGYGGPGVKPCGRLATGADKTNTYSQALQHCHTPAGPEIHCLGEVWSHGLIDLLKSLPPDAAGRPPIVVDLLLSQFAYQDNETFAQAVNILLAADDAVYGDGTPGSGTGVNRAAICAEMKTARGISASGCP